MAPSKELLAILLFQAVGIYAQAPVYGQCGGIGWTGATTCASGSTCVYSNPYYSQCLPGSSPNPTTTLATTTRTTTRAGTTPVTTTTTTARTTTTTPSAPGNEPATFTANPNIGPGGSSFRDSPHFRVYGATSTSAADAALNMLEAAYSCFVGTLGWRSPGLSYNDNTDDDGPWTKINIYSVSTLPGAAGVMHADYATGMAWLEVVHQYLTIPGVTVHELGHGMHYHEKTWVDQGRTGAWWETVANFVADTFKTSPLCASARSQYGQSATATEINLSKVIGDSFQVIVDGSVNTGNYYEAWPFLAYLTYNPDGYSGLGTNALRNLFRQYAKNSNETPLHTLARVSNAGVPIIVGRYWARMAYADIGHPTAGQVFLSQRSRLNYANLDSQGNNAYKPKSARRPLYMGANIVPLKKSGAVTVSVSVSGATLAYTATLSIRNTSSGSTRYVNLSGGSASASVASDEEITFVIANTPANLILYDAFSLSSEVKNGLDYSVTITGATP
ncbi:hypothetical protein AOL_s00054g547 [Orbilia oligospora ATCC 24927]|uniref:CBM1 domain-containing protein n=1 Tax=Arthrobotrys oligospora (strain ATCC 24927 / CBS 115.81 / DSM 1491) TaxID=756982 RepID=G1X6Q3_ARTOA|nr:hypothetical protein AOL_s00054g547 [Orbilia oligospora ATCC 24927]EGX51171.1 hypothetical protein AOL_s00054g547 [Orbilia oligospora ATCC 24927]